MAPASDAERILISLCTREIVGEVTDRRHGIKMTTADGNRDPPLYEQDEITRI